LLKQQSQHRKGEQRKKWGCRAEQSRAERSGEKCPKPPIETDGERERERERERENKREDRE